MHHSSPCPITVTVTPSVHKLSADVQMMFSLTPGDVSASLHGAATREKTLRVIYIYIVKVGSDGILTT